MTGSTAASMYPSCGITRPIHREITVPNSVVEPTSAAAPIAVAREALSAVLTRPSISYATQSGGNILPLLTAMPQTSQP
ncbi:hypothetical protein GCM10009574_095720 [Streptomyces asiaticus]|uniref:Uncharacterized protein n=2 Tax=Streptomyces rhizosphaericus TaxID=114699 RepID=A0ABP4D529_9ACTN